MSDEQDTNDTAELESSQRFRLSPVWLIPIAAILIGCWLLYDNFATRGPVVTLKMDSADGITADKTQLKVRSVPVGHVTKVTLSDDYKGAVITVQMNADTKKLLGDDSKFWVVRPQIGPQGISGLNTIISGAYLQMRPGKQASDQRTFTVRDNPPAMSSDEKGIMVKLVNQGDSALSVSAPVVYQGHNVGVVQDSHFSVAKKHTIYSIFIKQPYSKLLTQNTQFWMQSGLDVHIGSGGVDMEVGSLQSIIKGGITFGEPEDIKSSKPAQPGERFKLYASAKAAREDRYKRKLYYVILLDDSVRGLSAGAPVEYRGLRLGTVEKVPFYTGDFDLTGFHGFKIPILIALEPQRPGLSWADWSNDEWKSKNEKFFEHGLRATIKSSNLLTGSMMIDLNFDPHRKGYKAQTLGGYPVFPSVPSSITSIQQKLTELVDKINNLDLEPITDQVKETANSVTDTLKQLQQATRQINELLSDPATRQMPAQINETLKALQKTLDNFQQGGPTYRRLNDTIEHLNQVLDNAAPLMRTLNDHPDALIFGRPNGQDPIPKASP